MFCNCGGATSVVDSRPTETGGVRRQRRCKTCSEEFITVEMRSEEDVKRIFNRKENRAPVKKKYVPKPIRVTNTPRKRAPKPEATNVPPPARKRIEDMREQRQLVADDIYSEETI